MVRNTFEIQNIGDLLREKRKQLGQDIKDVADHTRIRAEYLLALESGNYEKFASDVYAKGFLKKYAKYLGINPERAAAMYRREQSVQSKSVLRPAGYMPVRAMGKDWGFSIGRISMVIVIFIVALALVYIGAQTTTVLKQPDLSVSAPVEVHVGEAKIHTTSNDTVTIRGKVDIGSRLKLNESEVNLNNLQTFEIPNQPLVLGDNIFNLVAVSQFGQQSSLQLKVLKEAAVKTDVPVNPIANSLQTTISILNADTLLRVQADNTTVFNQILQVGQIKNFTAQSRLTVSSSNPKNIDIQINGEKFNLDSTATYIFTLNQEGKVTQTRS